MQWLQWCEGLLSLYAMDLFPSVHRLYMVAVPSRGPGISRVYCITRYMVHSKSYRPPPPGGGARGEGGRTIDLSMQGDGL